MPFSCPLCSNTYAQLSQHLRVTHKGLNVTERRLILSLELGRVHYREGTCVIPGCGKKSSRLDRHIQGHTELSKAAQQDAIRDCKRKKVLEQLAALRASCPAIPMATFLDVDEAQNFWDEAEERPGPKIADLNKQNDTLATTLREVTQRYRKLKRKVASLPSTQMSLVTKRLLSTLEAEEVGEPSREPSEEATGQPSVEPSEGCARVSAGASATTTQPEPQDDLPYFLEHIAALSKCEMLARSLTHSPTHSNSLSESQSNRVCLSFADDLINEYKAHQEGSDPSANLKNNVASKIFRIRNFLGYMAEGKSGLTSLLFLNDTAKIRQWVAKLRSSKITDTTIHHYIKNVAQFLDYVSETPPATCHLSKAALVGIRQEVRTFIKGMRRRVVTHEYAVKTAKEGKLIPKATLVECHAKAKKMIPVILGEFIFHF